MFDDQKIEKIYRSKNNVKPIIGLKHIVYWEDITILPFLLFIAVFVISTLFLFEINISIFPKPPAPIYINDVLDFSDASGGVHLIYWLKMFANSFVPAWFVQDVLDYKYMGSWLDSKGYIYALIVRFLLAISAGLCAASWLIINRINNPIPSEITEHKRGTRVLKGIEAITEFAREIKDEISESGAFVKIAVENGMKAILSVRKMVNHFLVVGSSGSGKTQFMLLMMKLVINLAGRRKGSKADPVILKRLQKIHKHIDENLVAVVLDTKYEFTEMFYDETNPSHAILDYTDARSHEWDYSADLFDEALMRNFATSYIPKSSGENSVFSDSARINFVAVMFYLSQELPDYNADDIYSMLTSLSITELHYIFSRYYPEAVKTLGMLDENGNAEANTTSFGVEMNLIASLAPLKDMARFTNPLRKKISLRKFLTDPNYPIKVLFIKPNNNLQVMSKAITRSALNYMISMIDSPDILESKKLKGVFFLDEFHQPGKLVDEDGNCTLNALLDRGRSNGYSCVLAVQTSRQIDSIYDEKEWKKWRDVTTSFVLTGTAPGETANEVSDIIGQQYFDKFHTSFNTDPQTGKVKIGGMDVQEHDRKAILGGELASYLKPSGGENPKIRYLYIARGFENVYIFEAPMTFIPKIAKPWMEQKPVPFHLGRVNRAVAHVRNTIAIENERLKQEKAAAIALNNSNQNDPDMITVDAAEARARIGDDAKYHMDINSLKEDKKIPQESKEEVLKRARQAYEDLKKFK